MKLQYTVTDLDLRIAEWLDRGFVSTSEIKRLYRMASHLHVKLGDRIAVVRGA